MNFELFYQDMAPTWKKGLSLGRKNNHRGYSPSNCEWQTSEQQNNNVSHNRVIRIGDKEKNLGQWCKYYGISFGTFYMRLKKGMNEEQAVSWPKGVRWNKPHKP